MPYYDLRCEDCQHPFTVKASVEERGSGRLSCPACGSGHLAAVFRKVNVLRYAGKDCDACAAGSGPMAASHSCGGSCGCHRA
jgi:putative FmdB family regulatory protein